MVDVEHAEVHREVGQLHAAVVRILLLDELLDCLAILFVDLQSQVSFQKSIPTAVASFAYGFDWKGTNRRKIVIAQSEEHSVLVTLLRVAQTLGLQVETVSISSDGILDLSDLDQAVDTETGIVAVSHVTVGAGVINPILAIS